VSGFSFTYDSALVEPASPLSSSASTSLGVPPAAAAPTRRLSPSKITVSFGDASDASAASAFAASSSSAATSAHAHTASTGGSSADVAAAPSSPSSQLLSASELVLENVIGAGAYGQVWAARYRGERVAVKQPKLRALSDSLRAMLVKELRVMSEKRHPNILLMMGAIIDTERFWIVTELLDCTLRQLLARQRFTLSQKLALVDMVAHGMNWLHAPTTVLHLDLKLDNVLVDGKQRLRIADFGFAAVKAAQVEYIKGDGHVIGNLLHKAPELLRDDVFDERADVYSFGILAWECLSGGDWDSCVTEAERVAAGSSLAALEATFKRAILAGRRPHRLASIPAPLYELLASCWHDVAERRPLFPQLLPRLADAKLDAALGHDRAGIALWRSAFGVAEEVPWRTFAARFYAALQIDLTSRSAAAEINFIDEHVHALVDPSDSQVARAEDFGRMLRAFGPLPTRASATAPDVGRIWLDDLCHVLEQPWFYGNLSANDAIRALRGQAVGSFLVRFSSDESIPFTVSVVSHDSHCEHIRVHRVAGRVASNGLRLYSLKGESYYSVLRDSDASQILVPPELGDTDSARWSTSAAPTAESLADEEQFASIAALVDSPTVRSDLSFLLPCVQVRSHFQALRAKRMTHDYRD
jgi:hypothetical protein